MRLTMKLFLDSSSFAKRFILEKGSKKIDQLCLEGSALGLSIICLPEILSAFNRRLREKHITEYHYALLKKRLLEDCQDTEIIHLTAKVIASATVLLEVNPLHAMDALHVACAIEWKADLFVSSDKKQIQAAKNARLACKYV